MQTKPVTFTKTGIFFGQHELPNDETKTQLEKAGFTQMDIEDEDRITQYFYMYPEIPAPTPKQAIIYIGFTCFILGLALGLFILK
jgi:hypothetical protein